MEALLYVKPDSYRVTWVNPDTGIMGQAIVTDVKCPAQAKKKVKKMDCFGKHCKIKNVYPM